MPRERDQRRPVVLDVEQPDRLRVQAELRPGQLLHQLVQRPEAARQRDEARRTGRPSAPCARAATPTTRSSLRPAWASSRSTSACGITPITSPPAAQRPVGNRAHQADAASAVDDAQAAPGERRAERARGVDVRRPAPRSRRRRRRRPAPPRLHCLTMKGSLPVAERPRRPEWMKVRAPSANSSYFDVKKLLHGAQPEHDLRRGALPEHRRVLGPRHRDLPDPRRHVHARLPLLLRQLRQAERAGRPARAAAPRAGGEADGPRSTSSSRRSTATTSPTRAPATTPRRSARLKRSCRTRRSRCSRRTSSASRRRRCGRCSARGPTSSTTTSRPSAGCTARMRGAKASYDGALWLLRRAKELADYNVLTKSGIIVGLGETNDEVVETMRDLRAHDVDVVTIGQYLQPSAKHATIDRWVHPDEFRWFREQGEALGFGSVFSRPARALELPRRRAAPRCGHRPRRRMACSRIPVIDREARAPRRGRGAPDVRTGGSTCLGSLVRGTGHDAGRSGTRRRRRSSRAWRRRRCARS